jgi:hypothetical protein
MPTRIHRHHGEPAATKGHTGVYPLDALQALAQRCPFQCSSATPEPQCVDVTAQTSWGERAATPDRSPPLRPSRGKATFCHRRPFQWTIRACSGDAPGGTTCPTAQASRRESELTDSSVTMPPLETRTPARTMLHVAPFQCSISGNCVRELVCWSQSEEGGGSSPPPSGWTCIAIYLIRWY